MPPVIERIDKEAFSIARVCGGRCGHCTEGVVGKQLFRILEAVDTNEERRQIGRRRNPTAVRIHSGDVHPVRITPNLAIIFDLAGHPVLQRVSGNLHISNAATLENIFLDVLLIRLAGKFLCDASKQAIVGTGKGFERVIYSITIDPLRDFTLTWANSGHSGMPAIR